jgi:hypothetical protein
MHTWKRSNTARDIKGISDAPFRADLKSKVVKKTKEDSSKMQAGSENADKRTAPSNNNKKGKRKSLTSKTTKEAAPSKNSKKGERKTNTSY